MRVGLYLVLAMLVGAVFAHFMLEDRGYVLVNFADYSIEMSLPMLVVVLLVLYLLVRFLIHAFRAPRKVGEATGRYRDARAARQLDQAMIEMSEGRFLRGERLLGKGAGRSQTPLISYLGAAKAAQLQGAGDRRDKWLKIAGERVPQAGNAVLLTQAEYQIEHKHYEQALATLRKLDEKSPGLSQSLALMADLYQKMNDWEQLRKLLPRLRKSKALKTEGMADIERRLYNALLARAADRGDGADVHRVWQEVPRALKNDPSVFLSYANGLVRGRDHESAEQTLRRRLKSEWKDEFVALYGELKTESPPKQLKVVEGWLKIRGDDPVLLLASAKIAMHNELWGKARSYLESSLAIEPSADAYEVYGRLLEQLGERAGATDAFRSGLRIAVDVASQRLPALEGPDQLASEDPVSGA